MIEKVSHVTVLVRDIDEALKFYTEKLGLEIAEDSKMPSGDRWLTVSPRDRNVQIVLQKPSAAMFGPLAGGDDVPRWESPGHGLQGR